MTFIAKISLLIGISLATTTQAQEICTETDMRQDKVLPTVTPACAESMDGCDELKVIDRPGTASDLAVFRSVTELLQINGLSDEYGPCSRLPLVSATLTIRL